MGTAYLTINLDGVLNMCRNVVESMCERGYGRIANISSVNGQTGQLGQTNYTAAAKAGMHGFTMALAREVARKGVTVNSVSPGYCKTADGSCRCRKTCARKSSPTSRSAGSASRRKSPASSTCLPLSIPASSPARTFRSTAATSWISERDPQPACLRWPSLLKTEMVINKEILRHAFAIVGQRYARAGLNHLKSLIAPPDCRRRD